ncbi:MAG: DNA polymerase III subunit alpha, partial [Clostridia bacterium]|nr:DNA polymerase III subunit alpha [Clostridia bacterium]
AGYTYGHADLVRRAMAKKKPEVMAKEKGAFIEGCVNNGISAAAAEGIFETMSEFAKYAFNKSHAAAYAVTSYRTAYLKCHYPREYMCSLLNTVMGYNEKVSEYIADCARMGISLLAPDVNASGAGFTAEGNNIRFGLAAVRNVGELFARRVIAEREARAFSGIEDFITRCCGFGSVKAFESLILAGALDGFGLKRSVMIAGLEAALSTVTRDKSRNSEGQMSLFGGESAERAFEYPRADLPEYIKSELLAGEKENTGLYFSGHPLEGYRAYARAIGAAGTAALRSALENGAPAREVKFIGLVTKKQTKVTKKNDMMAIVTAEDDSGELEAVIFPKLYTESGHIISENSVLVFTGTPELDDRGEEGEEKLKLKVRGVSLPGKAEREEPMRESKTAVLYIKVTGSNSARLADAIGLAVREKGESELRIFYEKENRISRKQEIRVDERLVREIKALMGEENVVVK